MSERGKFIAFEGIDGSGKTTQAKMLAKGLKTLGYDVVLTREPGGTEKGKAIRELALDKEVGGKDPKLALFLFLADRRLHLLEVIQPALGSGKIVICDRYEGSTLAYQVFAGGLDFKQVRAFNDYITDGLVPDLTIYLDVPVQIGRQRKAKQGIRLTHYDKKEVAFRQKLRQGYLKLAKILPSWVVIDGNGSPEEVHQRVVDVLRERGII